MMDAEKESDEGQHNSHGSIPVVDEILHLGKRVIETGRIRVIKEVDNEAVKVPLISRSTDYSVERILVNQYVDKAPPAIRHEGKTMILSIVEEEVVVQKRLKLVEEVRITLNESETVTQSEVVLKKERVIIERDHTKS